MKIDPEAEVRYRVKLAKGYLERAKRFFSTRDFRECVEASQLASENAAKAVIALRRVPSWSHDPSDELTEVAETLPEDARSLAAELAMLARELSVEHGVVTYGRPGEGLAPWELYGEPETRRILEKAERSVELMETLLEKLGWRG